MKTRGFLTFAQNGQTDYLRLAYGLALSLRATQKVPWLSVAVTPEMMVPDHYRDVFDQVIEIPWGDMASETDWKLENEWKAYHITPYRETIKLDADMLFTHDISSWWDIASKHSFLPSTSAKTYRGERITSSYYRQTFVDNDLPDVYSALWYFDISEKSLRVFEMMEMIFKHWDDFSLLLAAPSRPKTCTTDVALAMAVKFTETVVPKLPILEFTHMKSRLQGWPDGDEDWLKNIDVNLSTDLELRIGRYRQTIPLHYHVKDFLTDEMIARYECRL